MKLTAPIRRISESLPAALRVLLSKRAGTVAAALLVTLGTVWIPASRILPPANEGNGWGEIHWYEAEKAPAEAGAFRKSADFPFTPQ